MVQLLKFTATELLNNPRTRAVLILGALLIAALAGGAPSDHGGI